jgi:hypothetical protein
MRNAVLAALTLALVAGCGGGGKKTAELTRAQYISSLNKLCTSANRQVAALKLTTSMQSWKQSGARGAKVVAQTVKSFEALTPPDELKKAAEEYTSASEQIGKAVQDAAEAAKAGNTKKFDDALSRQQNFSLKANAAASEIGASACSGSG